jgi:hypothetical protein
MDRTSEVYAMTTNQLERPTKTTPPRDGWLGRAWISVVLIPLFLFISFALSYLLYDLFGYKPENNNAPLWVDLVVGLVGVVIFLVPCVAAMIYGRRASRSGDRRGLFPLGIGAVAACALLVLTVVTTVGDAVR